MTDKDRHPARHPDATTALLDPTAAFASPEDVVACTDLPAAMRVEILRRWEYDARELDVAEDESIIGHDEDSLLGRIHDALRGLGARLDPDAAVPTRQGGIADSALEVAPDDPDSIDVATRAALAEALDDEYQAQATYRAVIAAFGAVPPFVNIVEAEERHAAALLALFDRFGETPPVDRWTGKVKAPETLAEACAAAVAAEVDNAAMYERLLAAVDHPAVRRVLENLQAASRDNHLPAFRRCLARESGGRRGDGGGGGAGGGRRRRHRGGRDG